MSGSLSPTEMVAEMVDLGVVVVESLRGFGWLWSLRGRDAKESFEERDLAAAAGKREEVVAVEREREVGEERRSLEMERVAAIAQENV